MEDFVRLAVQAIRERYDEPLCLDELARVAMMSKFHFLRTFQHMTGVTPARFLSSVRIHEAKRLLRTTSLNVVDVSVQVGYNSVGSFTRRFTGSVNLSPTQYRRSCHGELVLPEASQPGSAARSGSVGGKVQVDTLDTSPVYLAAFRSRIPEGVPGPCTVLQGPGDFHLSAVPPGTWYLLAVTVSTEPVAAATAPEPPLLVATAGPLRVRPGSRAYVDLAVRPLRWSSPPVLAALPGLDVAPVSR